MVSGGRKDWLVATKGRSQAKKRQERSLFGRGGILGLALVGPAISFEGAAFQFEDGTFIGEGVGFVVEKLAVFEGDVAGLVDTHKVDVVPVAFAVVSEAAVFESDTGALLDVELFKLLVVKEFATTKGGVCDFTQGHDGIGTPHDDAVVATQFGYALGCDAFGA